MMDFKDELKFWLHKNGYAELLNDIAIDNLIRHIETEYIIPLKSELLPNEDEIFKKGAENIREHLKNNSNENL